MISADVITAIPITEILVIQLTTLFFLEDKYLRAINKGTFTIGTIYYSKDFEFPLHNQVSHQF